ncbi:MAG: DUF3795 domain-containing protein [Bacilli bacterium]|nr:DUF3795 domain-containing protein [Bacilli bacterium]
MKYETIRKKAFAVIGKEGSTEDGEGFIPRLYEAAEKGFGAIKSFVRRGEDGLPEGMYGLMSDFSRSYKPWEDHFSKGLYLAGYETNGPVRNVPEGWAVWNVKEQDYIFVRLEKGDKYEKVFNDFIDYYIPLEMKTLSGAVFDYSLANRGERCLLFPVKEAHYKKLDDPSKAHLARCGLLCSYCFFSACPGCEEGDCRCAYGYWCPDHVCLNVRCAKEKGLAGCYACPELEGCKFGLYATENKSAKGSALFVKKHGKEDLVKAVEGMVDAGLNWNKAVEACQDFREACSLLEKYR